MLAEKPAIDAIDFSRCIICYKKERSLELAMTTG